MRGMCGTVVIAFGLLSSLGFPAKCRAVDFGRANIYPVGASPKMVIAGDFNGDNKMDFAVLNQDSASVSILLGNGDGAFQPANNFDIRSTPGAKPVSIAAGDLNGDHKLDLIVCNAPSLSLYLGNGDGTFRPPIPLAVSGVGSTLLLADVNLDGKLDLIADNDLLLGNGDGTFQAPKDIGTSVAFVGDFNGDGKQDLLAGGMMLGNGDGTFQPPIALPSWGKCVILCQASGSNYVAADFNGDGKLDIASILALRTCDINCSPWSFSTLVMLVDGDGTFQLSKIPGPEGFFLVTSDFNGDGKPDLVAAPTVFHGSSLFHLLLGKGDGTFPSSFTFDIGSGPGFLVATDLNGDSLPDIVTTDFTEAAVSVLLNIGATSGADLALIVNPSSANSTVGSADLNYTATIINTGPDDASGVVLTHNLSSGLKLVSVQPSQGSCRGTTTITCDLGAITEPLSATVQFVVTPTTAGTFADVLDVAAAEQDANSGNNSATFRVNAVAPDFTVSPEAASLALKRGGQTSETLTFAAQAGFSGAIALTCFVGGPLPTPACAISPNSLTPGGSATLTVNAMSLSAALTPKLFNATTRLHATLLPMGIVGFVLVLFDRKRRRVWTLCLLLIVTTILPVACGGGSSNPPLPVAQNYTVTVTATSGTLQHSTTISVTVD